MDHIREVPSGTASTPELRCTAQIVAAYVARAQVPAEQLRALIGSVHAALVGVSEPAAAEPVRPEPAVPVKRSVFPDHIVCLEDGAKLKMLKRHLQSRYAMTPAQYRERWGLPADYPMVAPTYAERRSALAKSIGLGRKEAKPEAAVASGKHQPKPRRQKAG